MLTNMVRQGHDERFTESFTRLCIHWDLLLLCNYKCSYCYARNTGFYGEDWLKIPTWEHQQKIIEAISKCEQPMNIGLLGGEPTLYPHFNDLIDYLHLKCCYNEKYGVHNNIYIVTNGSKPNKWFKDLKSYSNMSFLWSYHPEFSEVQPFIDNVETMRDRGFGTKVNIMLHPLKRYRNKIEEVYQKCVEKGFKCHPHFLYQDNANTLWRYDSDFWEWSKEKFGNEVRDLEFQEDCNGVIKKHYFNDYEVYVNKLNSFKGYNCMNSNYEINANGRVIMYCAEKVFSNLITDPDFFCKNEIKTMKCPHTYCNCDGLLKVKKYKDGYE